MFKPICAVIRRAQIIFDLQQQAAFKFFPQQTHHFTHYCFKKFGHSITFESQRDNLRRKTELNAWESLSHNFCNFN